MKNISYRDNFMQKLDINSKTLIFISTFYRYNFFIKQRHNKYIYNRKDRSRMKLKKIIAALTAACTVLSAAAVSAFAYDVNKDFKTGWSVNTTIPASEFAELTEDSVITITYTADGSLAEKADHSYWVIKPMINDSGWPFIKDIACGSGMMLAESGDSYSLDVEGTQAQFSVTGDSVEQLKTAGMALMGHGITLETLTVDNNAVLETGTADTEEKNEVTEDNKTVPAADNNTEMPVTGNNSAAAAAVIISAAAIAMAASKKK